MLNELGNLVFLRNNYFHPDEHTGNHMAIFFNWGIATLVIYANWLAHMRYKFLPGYIAVPLCNFYATISQFGDSANTIFAMMNFLLVIKFIKLFNRVPQLNSLGRTILLSVPQMSVFLIVLGVVLISFTLVFYQLFCDCLVEFQSMQDSLFTMVRSLKGDFPDLVVMKKRQGIIAVALFSIYMILILFTALSILISIMSESYAKVDGNEEIMAECDNGSFMTMYYFLYAFYEDYSNLLNHRLLGASAQVISVWL